MKAGAVRVFGGPTLLSGALPSAAPQVPHLPGFSGRECVGVPAAVILYSKLGSQRGCWMR